MRRFGIALVVVSVLLSLALPAFANESVPEFRDTFAQQSFSGNDGSLDFNDPWVEVGESNGPTSGFVWVWNHEYCEGAFCLKMGGAVMMPKATGSIAPSISAVRPAQS